MIASLAAAMALAVLPAPAQGDLVAANHILVDRQIIDVRGHVSLRDPADPNRFWITRSIAPGLATPADLQAFDLDGNQVGGATGAAYTERFIHARIYRARQDVNAIVHAHTASLIAMSMSGQAVLPVSTAARFATAGVPVHVNGRSGDGIYAADTGDALARTLGPSGAVLMQGHGMVVVGPTLKAAVGRAVGLDFNTRIQIDLIAMGVKPVVLEPSAAPESDYAREWDWWVRELR